MSLPTDSYWWPPDSQIFDFSLKFEETMLGLVPSCSFLLLGAATYWYYRRRPVYIRDSLLLWTKLVSALIPSWNSASRQMLTWTLRYRRSLLSSSACSLPAWCFGSPTRITALI